MEFSETKIAGVYVVELNQIGDERGFFARSFCSREFADFGLEDNFVQCNVSYNQTAGTLRGLHFQIDPAREAKLVRCTQGAIVDVALDLRESSPTYLQHVMVELSAKNRKALYVPKHFAHGFQTLVDDTEATYQVSEFYTPESERGLRFDDPNLAIDWPREITHMSQKDASWPYLQ